MTEMTHPEAETGEPRLLDPVPDTAPPPDTSRRRGVVASYRYCDETGRLRLIVQRCEQITAEGKRKKDFFPHTAWQHDDGRIEWRMKGLPREVAVPLYRREVLTERPQDPVLVVEGEKCAEAAAAHLPAYVAVSILGGSSKVAHADLSALSGRDVVLVGDADEPGREAVETLIGCLRRQGVASLRVLDIEMLGQHVSGEVPAKYDIADAIADGLTAEGLETLCAEQRGLLVEPPIDWSLETVQAQLTDRFGMEGQIPYGFDIAGRWVWKEVEDAKGKPKMIPVSTPVLALGQTTDPDGEGWGMLVAVLTPQDAWASLIVPGAMLAGDGRELRERIARLGGKVALDRAGRTAFGELISYPMTSEIISTTRQPGWTAEGHFLTPTVTAAPPGLTRSALLDLPEGTTDFATRGDLAAWQEIAALAEGNPAIALGCMMGFAGPLMHLLGMAAPGIHLWGKSSQGKTTILFLAASIWGPAGRYTRAWSATTNGIEGIAGLRNHTLLVMDEMHLSDPADTADAVYIVANGAGKQRAGKTGQARGVSTWSTPLLSAGEGSFTAHMKAARARKLTGGLSVRLVDVAVGQGSGTDIGALHGHGTERALMETIRTEVDAHYGLAGPAFVTRLVSELGASRASARAECDRFVATETSGESDPQLVRVAQKFGLLAAAGRLATEFGLLPWSEDQAFRAAQACFRTWLETRGSAHRSQDEIDALTVLRDFFELHGPSRFPVIDEARDMPQEVETGPGARERCGYRAYDEEGIPVYYVFPGAWRRQVCEGRDPQLAAKAAAECGALNPGDGRHYAKRVRLPDYPGGTRVYVIRPDELP